MSSTNTNSDSSRISKNTYQVHLHNPSSRKSLFEQGSHKIVTHYTRRTNHPDAALLAFSAKCTIETESAVTFQASNGLDDRGAGAMYPCVHTIVLNIDFKVPHGGFDTCTIRAGTLETADLYDQNCINWKWTTKFQVDLPTELMTTETDPGKAMGSLANEEAIREQGQADMIRCDYFSTDGIRDVELELWSKTDILVGFTNGARTTVQGWTTIDFRP
ncbi:uncharacterized protein I303_105462 [Kwoniella dejecticola CBS 10117]|uniref:Uncharacterized protein n=1 Tax=Kwoniella dejecticola CBS 10117 TaxID=1296121 RepID=A0A1A6A2G5_9TREE|nr:uncharacterized protein I303_05096 [Kwoniella dejecticola CBS 10117]OBR84239.1 hypothetical protein I303_05096 [Kwoniella dejecticola CBS 10117]